jgi:predicted amidophosphoribosyltransferase
MSEAMVSGMSADGEGWVRDLRCPRCGADVKEGAARCPKCGLALTMPPKPREGDRNASLQRGKKHRW